MKKVLVLVVVAVLVVVGGLMVWNFVQNLLPHGPGPGEVSDEALEAKLTADDFPGADEDYYHDMDYGLTNDPDAARAALDAFVPGITAAQATRAVARGRNNWIVWTAGNDRFWDELSRRSTGLLDLVKTISNHPELPASRDNRWQYLGLVNEPCFRKATGPRADRYGLWLDERTEGPGCPPDPFENEQKYPGVKIGARGENLPVGSHYGYGTGIVGLRLFPNPAFDEAAEAEWDAERYYTDAEYYGRPELVRPYRVGMSCGFCHVGPNPTNPPADPENPTWANLNSNPGAQYFWIDRIFMWKPDPSSFPFQLFHTSRPGALDTSLVSSDQINNPRTMNAIYNLPARLELTRKWGNERLAGGGLDNAQFNDFVPAHSALTRFYEAPDKVWTPRVLKDGADSVGALGALNRVFLNIGLFSEEWLLHFTPLLGGADITPIPIETARANSTYWNANEKQTPDLALFFVATARPDGLAAAPGGAGHLAAGEATRARGKVVFADTCARCHSSKLPEKAFTDFFPGSGCVGPNYLQCWNDYWAWTKTEDFKAPMRAIVEAPDFLDGNFLSTELRVPVTLLETNACSPLATNAIEGNIWDNFSSASYKSLPSVGRIRVQHPYNGAVSEYEMPGGGRGFTRPASLVSLWSTAPFLLNNTVGPFEWTGSVEGRLRSFERSMEQMLWPQRREGDFAVVTASGKRHPGIVDRTTERSYLRVAPGYLPPALQRLSGPLDWLFPNFFGSGGVQIGPIPEGTPINLLSNIDLQKKKEVVRLLLAIKHDLEELPAGASDEEARAQFAHLVPRLLEVSKCPDFVVNRGHYFGTDYLPAAAGEQGLSDADKRALIEFLKTF